MLSVSSLVSNGVMATGGPYYLISRAMGPEFGGAMGLLFYAALSVGVAYHTIGFATTMQATWFPTGDYDEATWYRRGIGSVALFSLLLVGLAGAGFFAKFNTLFFVVRLSAIMNQKIDLLSPFILLLHFLSTDSVWRHCYWHDLLPDPAFFYWTRHGDGKTHKRICFISDPFHGKCILSFLTQNSHCPFANSANSSTFLP